MNVLPSKLDDAILNLQTTVLVRLARLQGISVEEKAVRDLIVVYHADVNKVFAEIERQWKRTRVWRRMARTLEGLIRPLKGGLAILHRHEQSFGGEGGI